MKKLVLALTACVLACTVKSRPPPDPCAPNPCTDANKTTCVVENATARCLCAQGFVARPSGACEAVTAANCPQHPGDSAEPDDCMTAAKPIKTTDQPRSQTIEPVGDYDFVQLTAENNFVYNVTVKAAGSPVLPRIDAFDQGGVWLSGIDGPGIAVLSFKAHYAGPHFLRVSHSPLDPSVA
ncbi:MAG: hypothetical protein ACJ790_18715, partial [Myxococcaceae bacterium]